MEKVHFGNSLPIPKSRVWQWKALAAERHQWEMCNTLTTVDEVRIVSQDRPRDMAVQVKKIIPGWPGDAHLLSNLLQRLCGH